MGKYDHVSEIEIYMGFGVERKIQLQKAWDY